MPKLPQRPDNPYGSEGVGIRLKDARTGELGPVQYARKLGSVAGGGSYNAAPGAPSLHDPAKMGMIYQDLARQRAAFADGDVDPMGTKFAQSLLGRVRANERARAQRQLQQMGSSIHGGAAEARAQHQRAAMRQAEIDIAAASEQQLLAKRAQKTQELNSYYNNLLRGMGFEAGLQSQDFKNEFQRWMTQQGLDQQEQAQWMGMLGQLIGGAATVGSSYLLGPAGGATAPSISGD